MTGIELMERSVGPTMSVSIRDRLRQDPSKGTCAACHQHEAPVAKRLEMMIRGSKTMLNLCPDDGERLSVDYGGVMRDILGEE